MSLRLIIKRYARRYADTMPIPRIGEAAIGPPAPHVYFSIFGGEPCSYLFKPCIILSFYKPCNYGSYTWLVTLLDYYHPRIQGLDTRSVCEACFRDLNTSLVKCLSSLTKTSLVYTRVYEPCTVHDTRLVAVRGSYTKAILYTSRIQGSYGV